MESLSSVAILAMSVERHERPLIEGKKRLRLTSSSLDALNSVRLGVKGNDKSVLALLNPLLDTFRKIKILAIDPCLIPPNLSSFESLVDLECTECSKSVFGDLVLGETAHSYLERLCLLNSQVAPNDLGLSASVLAHLKEFEYQNGNLSNTIDDLSSFFGELVNVEYINLDYNMLSKFDLLFKDCVRLRGLSCAHNHFSDISELHNGILGNIAFLDLSNNAIKSTDGLEKLLSLESLDISFNLIDDWNEIQRLLALPLLEWLSIKGNPVIMSTAASRAVLNPGGFGYNQIQHVKFSQSLLVHSVLAKLKERARAAASNSSTSISLSIHNQDLVIDTGIKEVATASVGVKNKALSTTAAPTASSSSSSSPVQLPYPYGSNSGYSDSLNVHARAHGNMNMNMSSTPPLPLPFPIPNSLTVSPNRKGKKGKGKVKGKGKAKVKTKGKEKQSEVGDGDDGGGDDRRSASFSSVEAGEGEGEGDEDGHITLTTATKAPPTPKRRGKGKVAVITDLPVTSTTPLISFSGSQSHRASASVSVNVNTRVSEHGNANDKPEVSVSVSKISTSASSTPSSSTPSASTSIPNVLHRRSDSQPQPSIEDKARTHTHSHSHPHPHTLSHTSHSYSDMTIGEASMNVSSVNGGSGSSGVGVSGGRHHRYSHGRSSSSALLPRVSSASPILEDRERERDKVKVVLSTTPTHSTLSHSQSHYDSLYALASPSTSANNNNDSSNNDNINSVWNERMVRVTDDHYASGSGTVHTTDDMNLNLNVNLGLSKQRPITLTDSLHLHPSATVKEGERERDNERDRSKSIMMKETEVYSANLDRLRDESGSAWLVILNEMEREKERERARVKEKEVREVKEDDSSVSARLDDVDGQSVSNDNGQGEAVNPVITMEPIEPVESKDEIDGHLNADTDGNADADDASKSNVDEALVDIINSIPFVVELVTHDDDEKNGKEITIPRIVASNDYGIDEMDVVNGYSVWSAKKERIVDVYVQNLQSVILKLTNPPESREYLCEDAASAQELSASLSLDKDRNHDSAQIEGEGGGVSEDQDPLTACCVKNQIALEIKNVKFNSKKQKQDDKPCDLDEYDYIAVEFSMGRVNRGGNDGGGDEKIVNILLCDCYSQTQQSTSLLAVYSLLNSRERLVSLSLQPTMFSTMAETRLFTFSESENSRRVCSVMLILNLKDPVDTVEFHCRCYGPVETEFPGKIKITEAEIELMLRKLIISPSPSLSKSSETSEVEVKATEMEVEMASKVKPIHTEGQNQQNDASSVILANAELYFRLEVENSAPKRSVLCGVLFSLSTNKNPGAKSVSVSESEIQCVVIVGSDALHYISVESGGGSGGNVKFSIRDKRPYSIISGVSVQWGGEAIKIKHQDGFDLLCTGNETDSWRFSRAMADCGVVQDVMDNSLVDKNVLTAMGVIESVDDEDILVSALQMSFLNDDASLTPVVVTITSRQLTVIDYLFPITLKPLEAIEIDDITGIQSAGTGPDLNSRLQFKVLVDGSDDLLLYARNTSQWTRVYEALNTRWEELFRIPLMSPNSKV